jgi:hypothetical protein
LLQEDDVFGEVLGGTDLAREMRFEHSTEAFHDERPIGRRRSEEANIVSQMSEGVEG